MDIFNCKDGMQYKIANEKEFLKAQNLRHDVYLDVGYIDKPCNNRVIPDDKDVVSEYIVAVNPSLDVVGTMRLTPLKFSADLFEAWKESMLSGSEEFIRMARDGYSMELGALAVLREFRRYRISWGLYKATLLYSLIRGFEHWVIAMDNRALQSLETLGWSVYKIGESIMYMGSLTTLGIMPIHEQINSIAEKNQKFYSYISA